MSYTEEFQRLETTKFSIRSPQARIAKRVQQELIRASERRRRPGKTAINRYLLGKVKEEQEQDASTGRRGRPRGTATMTVQEAHKYLPQCDELMQNAADLYIASELRKKNISSTDIKSTTKYDHTVRCIAQQFMEQPTAVQKEFLRAALLLLSKQSKMVPCSDPFLLLLDLHWKQTRALNRQRFKSRREENIDIGPYAVNIERAESGEESDPTRLRLITLSNCTNEARSMWKHMSANQKLPFFVQAYLATHLPASLDRAL